MTAKRPVAIAPGLRNLVADRGNGTGRAAVVIAAAASIVLIAAIDYATGIQLSLSVFYLLPVAAVAISVSPLAGYLLAALASVAWTLADVFIPTADRSPALQAVNGILHLATLALVVALATALRRALHGARSSEQRSKEFLAYAAHQLRTPVAGIQASAEALVLTGDLAARDQLVSSITAETTRMGRLVAALLRIARLDQGDPLEIRPTDIAAVVAGEVERARALAPHLAFDLVLGTGSAGAALVDPTALGEIVANLLDNARRHASTRVDVRLQRHPGVVHIAVSDDGPGLPAGLEERAFERFVSLDGRGGAGLGLAIARSLAEAQGGTVSYASREFIVTLQPSLTVDAPPPGRRPSGTTRSVG